MTLVRELPVGQKLRAMDRALTTAKPTFPDGQLRKMLPLRHRKRNLVFLHKIQVLVEAKGSTCSHRTPAHPKSGPKPALCSPAELKTSELTQ